MPKSPINIKLPLFTNNRTQDLNKLLKRKFVKKDDSTISYKFSTYSNHLEQIKNAINTPNEKELTRLLNYKMEDSITLTFVEKTHANLNTGAYTTTPPEYWLVQRPYIEWVIFNKPDDFYALINLLLNSSKQCYDVFIRHLKTETDLRGCIDNLLLWNDETVTQLNGAIELLNEYGNKLNKEKVAKGDIMRALGATLSHQVKEYHEKQKTDESSNSEWQKSLEHLKFKIELKTLLHSHDKTLNEYRGYGRLIANFFSILFTAGIANFFNLSINGKFLFFDKVTTKKLVDNIDHTINYRPGV